MITRILCSLFLVLLFTESNTQVSASQLLDKSIKYHDPQGKLTSSKVVLHFKETRPNGSDRKSMVELWPLKEQFKMSREIDGVKVKTEVDKNQFTHHVGGNSPNKEQIEKYRLTSERSEMMRNYYHYLWYMPLKLKDPGTIIDPEIKTTDFFGKQALEMKVTYEHSVGGDIWYFYFHPETSALIGYRFYHDESANDGEYITFEGETISDGVRIPKVRTWYTHKEDKLLGTDILERLEIK